MATRKLWMVVLPTGLMMSVTGCMLGGASVSGATPVKATQVNTAQPKTSQIAAQANNQASVNASVTSSHSPVATPTSSSETLAQTAPITLPRFDGSTAPLTAQMMTYTSTVLGGQRTYQVSLPPGYDQNPNQRYPVIFLLHGGSGGPTDWFQVDKGNALPTLLQLYQAGKLPPSIVITPDGNDKRGRSSRWDPQYFDGPNGNMRTALGDELVRVVQSRYRTLPAPDFWAMGGLSSGAWGAVNIGLRSLNHFSILFSHSGYFIDSSGPQNSPMRYISSLSRTQLGRVKIYLDSGQSDGEYLQESTQFHQLLNQLGVQNQFNVFPGTHSWQYWRQHLADSLTYVGSQWMR